MRIAAIILGIIALVLMILHHFFGCQDLWAIIALTSAVVLAISGWISDTYLWRK